MRFVGRILYWTELKSLKTGIGSVLYLDLNQILHVSQCWLSCLTTAWDRYIISFTDIITFNTQIFLKALWITSRSICALQKTPCTSSSYIKSMGLLRPCIQYTLCFGATKMKLLKKKHTTKVYTGPLRANIIPTVEHYQQYCITTTTTVSPPLFPLQSISNMAPSPQQLF